MKVLGDINLATASTVAVISALISWVVSRATTTRQARAGHREDARRAIQRLITPALGHVRLTLSACHGLTRNAVSVPVGSWSAYGGHDLMKDLARLCDDLGPIRRRVVRRAARRVFGRSDYALAMFYRWSRDDHVFDAMLRAQFTASTATRPPKVRRRAVRPGLWAVAAGDRRDLAAVRTLERQLCRIYAVGGLRVVEPGIVTRRERLSARWCHAVRWAGDLREPVPTPARWPVPAVAPPGRGAVVVQLDTGAPAGDVTRDGADDDQDATRT